MLLAKKSVYVYRLRHNMDLVDLRPENEFTCSFLHRLADDPGVRAAQRDLQRIDMFTPTLDLVKAVLAPDYGVYGLTRPIGIAALQLQGAVCATSLRETFETDSQGENLVFGGDDGAELELLEPLYRMIEDRDQSDRPFPRYEEVDVDDLASPYSANTLVDLDEE